MRSKKILFTTLLRHGHPRKVAHRPGTGGVLALAGSCSPPGALRFLFLSRVLREALHRGAAPPLTTEEGAQWRRGAALSYHCPGTSCFRGFRMEKGRRIEPQPPRGGGAARRPGGGWAKAYDKSDVERIAQQFSVLSPLGGLVIRRRRIRQNTNFARVRGLRFLFLTRRSEASGSEGRARCGPEHTPPSL